MKIPTICDEPAAVGEANQLRLLPGCFDVARPSSSDYQQVVMLSAI
jgi:hypothetical protein